ncbi:indirect negative regulator of sigma-B activity [Ornithinibacillus xuwenensis]|uniref:Indirect negative regulator of sigma-B activity n=1 Tax=Ornithinibacillus xuwenensis TaxID=3144668 RepID=A0ABU9XNX4_9BACI
MNRVKVSVFQEAKNGNVECGDSYYYQETDEGFICALADGLGSGQYAKESSKIVIDIIEENFTLKPEELIVKCNKQLIGKRGAVLAIFKMDYVAHAYTISLIGNIGVMSVSGDKKRKYIPIVGYLSGCNNNLKVIREPLEEEMNFIMYTDGVTNQDLSQNYFYDKDVERITKCFALKNDGPRKDDTTLIAIHYNRA